MKHCMRYINNVYTINITYSIFSQRYTRKNNKTIKESEKMLTKILQKHNLQNMINIILKIQQRLTPLLI